MLHQPVDEHGTDAGDKYKKPGRARNGLRREEAVTSSSSTNLRAVLAPAHAALFFPNSPPARARGREWWAALPERHATACSCPRPRLAGAFCVGIAKSRAANRLRYFTHDHAGVSDEVGTSRRFTSDRRAERTSTCFGEELALSREFSALLPLRNVSIDLSLTTHLGLE